MKRLVYSMVLCSSLAIAQSKIVEEVVAVVNGDAITRSDFEETQAAVYRALAGKFSGDELKNKFEEAKSHILDNMIEDMLLSQEAKSKNFNVDSEIGELIENLKKENNITSDEDLERAMASEGFTIESYKAMARERLLKQRLIGREVDSKIDISEEELHNYYSTHTPEFEVPARLHLREVFVGIENRSEDAAAIMAANARSRIAESGEDFDAVAREVSESPSKDQGGDLGWLDEPDLAPDLKEAIAGLQKGGLSPVIKSPKGCRVIKLEDRQEPMLKTFEDVKQSIEGKLHAERRGAAVDEYLRELRKSSYIFIPGK